MRLGVWSRPTEIDEYGAPFGVSVLAAVCMGEGLIRILYPEFGFPVRQHKLFTEYDPLLGWRKIPNFRGLHTQPEYQVIVGQFLRAGVGAAVVDGEGGEAIS